MPTASEAKEALATALLDTPGIAAIVGRRIYPGTAARGVEPYLIFDEISGVQPKMLRGKCPLRRSRFRLLGVCRTRVQASALMDEIEELLDGKSNSLFGGLLVKCSLIADDEGNVDEDESPLAGHEFGDRAVRTDLVWVY